MPWKVFIFSIRVREMRNGGSLTEECQAAR